MDGSIRQGGIHFGVNLRVAVRLTPNDALKMSGTAANVYYYPGDPEGNYGRRTATPEAEPWTPLSFTIRDKTGAVVKVLAIGSEGTSQTDSVLRGEATKEVEPGIYTVSLNEGSATTRQIEGSATTQPFEISR